MNQDNQKIKQIADIIETAETIVIIQADNPDIDSLASALALEAILGELGKNPILYCGVDLPIHLHYLAGWDRVQREMPKNFDASIIVDTTSDTLLEQLTKNGGKSWMAAKPSIILDHHKTEATINFANVIYNPTAVATGEVIYELANKLKWPVEKDTKKLIAIAILGDSLGLMSDATSARSIHIIAEIVEAGVNLAEIDAARRATMRRDPELIHYKGKLLQRVEFHSQGRISIISIPWEEIETYSPLYNPTMLVMDDMRLGKDTCVAIGFKIYRDGKITAKIRCNYGYPVGDKLAEHFGGGGHPLASGFKLLKARPYEELKEEVINVAEDLLSKL